MSSRNLRPVKRKVTIKMNLTKSPFRNLGFVDAVVGVNSTWQEFLISKCNISSDKITEELPLYVCNSRFSWTQCGVPGPRRGWTATLDQRISDFLSNYHKQRTGSILSVRLITEPYARRSPPSPPDLAESVYRTAPPNEMASNPQSTVTSAGVDEMTARQGQSSFQASAFRNPTNFQARRNLHLGRIGASNGEARNLSEISLHSSGQRGVYVRQGQNSADRNSTNGPGPIIIDLEPMGAAGERDHRENEDDSDGDRWSEGTAAVEEEAELRRGGIQMQNLKPDAIVALNRVDNTILLKARREIQTLRRDGLWYKNVKRAPFCAFLVEELLHPQQYA